MGPDPRDWQLCPQTRTALARIPLKPSPVLVGNPWLAWSYGATAMHSISTFMRGSTRAETSTRVEAGRWSPK